MSKKLLHKLWANLSIFITGLAIFASVIPGLTSQFFSKFDFQPFWILWALSATILCLIATFGPQRTSKWRILAAGFSSSYLFSRALYLEWKFPELAPWCTFLQTVAFAVLIAWSWGRPPIIKNEILFPRKGKK